MARIVVTGGAGFIGSHLVDRLVADGHRVTVIDDFATGALDRLARHQREERLSIVRADVSDAAALAPHFEGVEQVFHLAALADIVPSIERPIAYHRANVDGTIGVLERARAAGVKRFVYSASSSCYGIPDVYPTPETAPIRPMYPYALTKWLGEEIVLHWGRVYGMSVVALRLFNVYGPRSRTTGAYGAVFGVFLAQKLSGKPFTVVGDGTQVRDFVFVSDVVEAFIAASRSSVSGETFNVGSGRPQSVNRLVELLGGPVTHVPKRPGEPDRTHADIAKIQRVLGWSPRVSFEEGCAEMLRVIEDWRAAPVWTPESIGAATREWFRYLGSER
ncbi:MAG TPA: SDR family oxidoreductase [Planctomycetota bacterium]|nr:SDR family oxidoreductase [Planctomycetota bacterium]